MLLIYRKHLGFKPDKLHKSVDFILNTKNTWTA